jgi:hypothetical protein
MTANWQTKPYKKPSLKVFVQLFFKSWPPEARCFTSLLIILLMIFISISPAAEKDLKNMSFKEASEKHKELTRVKKFLQTDIAEKYPWSLNEFFDSSIYEKLVGNDFFGYYYDEGVKYDDPGNRITIDTIAVLKGRGYEKYKHRYTRIFLQTLRESEEYNYHVKKGARYSVGICLVSIKEKDDEESLKGVVLEAYIKDSKTGKHFYHRCSTGCPGELDKAMRLSAARVICNIQYLKQKFLEVRNPTCVGKHLAAPRQLPENQSLIPSMAPRAAGLAAGGK